MFEILSQEKSLKEEKPLFGLGVKASDKKIGIEEKECKVSNFLEKSTIEERLILFLTDAVLQTKMNKIKQKNRQHKNQSLKETIQIHFR